MHAIRLHAFGPPGNLTYEHVDDPAPGPGQARIRVAAAGVHLLDTTIRSGADGGPFPLPDLPQIPGREVAGTVDAVGPGVESDWIGRRVVGHLGMASGGYAELAVRETEALHVLPEGLGDDAAVAMIGTGRTTIGILDLARPRPDDVALVPAAAGGIGSLLVQALRGAGATVIALAGGAGKVARVQALGADAAIDYTAPGWQDAVRDVLAGRELTLALDGVGGAIGRAALELLGIGGRLVMFGWSSGTPTRLSAEDLYANGLTAAVVVGPRMLRRPGGLRSLEAEALAAAASGRLVPLVDSRFRLAEAGAAHAALEARATVGKVVLLP